MFWLYLLGLVTFLTIVVRRLMRRQIAMIDELFSKRVATDHVHDGLAWVTATGRIDYVNPALAHMLDLNSAELRGRSWLDLFAPDDRIRIENAYSRMLLSGKTWLEAGVLDSRGVATSRKLLIVAVHDHRTRFSGHYCILDHAIHAEASEEHLALVAR